MWLTPGRTSGRKITAPILFNNNPEKECYEEEVQPCRKTDYKPIIYIYIHADIITIHETKLTSKTKTPKVHNFTTVRTDKSYKTGGGFMLCCCIPTPLTLVSGGSPIIPVEEMMWPNVIQHKSNLILSHTCLCFLCCSS